MDWYQDFLLKYNKSLNEISGNKTSTSLINDGNMISDGVFKMDSTNIRNDNEKFFQRLEDKEPLNRFEQIQENYLDNQFPNRVKTELGDNMLYSILNSREQRTGTISSKGSVLDNKTYLEKMKEYFSNLDIPKLFSANNKKNANTGTNTGTNTGIRTDLTEGQLNNQISTILTGNDLTNQPNDFFTKVFGMSKDKMMQTWKDKGGFDALMSNPAFMIGLSFLQSSAQGKTISESALNNILKGGGISATYKKLLAGKTTSFEVTAADIENTKALMSDFGIGNPNAFEQIFSKFKGADAQKGYDAAVESIAMALQKAKVAAQKKAESTGKNFEWGYEQQKKVVEDIIRKEKIKHKKGFSIFGIRLTKGILEKDKSSYQLDGSLEYGGTAHEGKSYLVGEKGPEVFIPHETGEVVANDDSQVFTMLLAANPQLQKISKERAMKILQAKFPEYFD